MEKVLLELMYGSLLREIGRIQWRLSQGESGQSIGNLGECWLKQWIHSDNILEQVKYRQAHDIENAKLPKDSLAYLTFVAATIASGMMNGVDKEELSPEWCQARNLSDIFNQFGSPTEQRERYYRPAIFIEGKEYEFASEHYMKFHSQDYAIIERTLSEGFSQLDFSSDLVVNLLNLLEKSISFVPKSTHFQDGMLDVSLFDYSKLTCALSTCLYHYAKEQNISDYKTFFFEKRENIYDLEMFRLVSFDISGIQSFIYNIRDEKAAKMLKARSFYLEMIAENLIAEVIKQLSVSRANLLYSGGGHAYMIVPNTPESVEKLRHIEREMYEFMLEHFGADLYVAIASTPFKGKSLLKGNEKEYQNIYRQLSEQLSKKKLHRYSLEDIHALNDTKYSKDQGRECKMCRSVDKLIYEEDDVMCSVCSYLLQFARKLSVNDSLVIMSANSENPHSTITKLVIGKGKYLQSHNLLREKCNERETLYVKNKLLVSDVPIVNLWVGDYQKADTFEEYTSVLKQGIQRLAVMRCDVDNLGQAFIAGFSAEHTSFMRTATFSRQMSLFFKYYMNHLLEKLNTSATIIYSGGDDVFIVGGWLDIVEFSVALRQEFLQYTQSKLTLSTGIGLYPAKTPISIMALETGELEEVAKDNEKDSVTLFDGKNVFKWDEFIYNIWQDKYKRVSEFFNEMEKQQILGKGFVYRLLQLIEESFDEVGQDTRGKYKTMSWAKWAYYLSRMEPPKSKGNTKLIELYKQFRELLHGYFANEKEVKELKMALELYIYTIRGESNGTINR